MSVGVLQISALLRIRTPTDIRTPTGGVLYVLRGISVLVYQGRSVLVYQGRSVVWCSLTLTLTLTLNLMEGYDAIKSVYSLVSHDEHLLNIKAEGWNS